MNFVSNNWKLKCEYPITFEWIKKNTENHEVRTYERKSIGKHCTAISLYIILNDYDWWKKAERSNSIQSLHTFGKCDKTCVIEDRSVHIRDKLCSLRVAGYQESKRLCWVCYHHISVKTGSGEMALGHNLLSGSVPCLQAGPKAKAWCLLDCFPFSHSKLIRLSSCKLQR